MKCFLVSFFLFSFIKFNTGYDTVSIYTKLQINKSKIDRKLPWEDINCKTDEECQSRIIQSKCIDKFCKCSSDTVLSSDASKCLPQAKAYGSPCEDNIQCSMILSSGGVCENNECKCKKGYHYLKGSCWKSINLNEKCYLNEQCYSAYEYVGLQCEKSICKCRAKYRSRLSSGCRRERVTSETCNLDFDCIDNSICESMRCTSSYQTQTIKFEKDFQNFNISTNFKRSVTSEKLDCSKGMFEHENKCVLELGMTCTSNSDCGHIENALCLDDLLCACEPVFYVASENNRQCLRVARGKVEDINRSSCTTNSECGVFGGNSVCQNKRCSCKSGTYFEKKNKFCWPIKSLNEPCRENEDCNPLETHAECEKTKQVCVCQEGYHSKDSKCLLNAWEVGDPCLNDDDCFLPNSYCSSSKTCTCKDRYYPENGKCKPGVETSCSNDADCAHLNNTNCRIGDSDFQQCLCLKNYTVSDHYKYCLPVVGYKGKCVETFQCKFYKGDQGVCKNNICECSEGEHYFNGKCYKTKRIGESCSKQPECFQGNDEKSVICLKGFCSCNYDYGIDDNGICVKTNSATTIKFYSGSLALLVIFLTLRI